MRHSRMPRGVLFVLSLVLHLADVTAKAESTNREPSSNRISYVSAGANAIHTPPGKPFKFDCPPIMQPHSIEHLQVVWTRDSAIWVKIIDGRPQITYKLKSIHVQKIHNRDFITLASNNRRYSFVYDALNARFSMSIDSVLPSDSGVWTCEVIFRRMHDANDQTTIDYRDLRAPPLRPKMVPSVYARSGTRSDGARVPSRAVVHPSSSSARRPGPRSQDRHGPVTYAHAQGENRQQIVTFSRQQPKTSRASVTGGGAVVQRQQKHTRYGRRRHSNSTTNHKGEWRRMIFTLAALFFVLHVGVA